MSTSLTVDDSATDFILEVFDKDVDDEGYIFNADGNRVTTPEGKELKKEEFAGVEKGSTIYLDDDFTTLVEHVKRRSQE